MGDEKWWVYEGQIYNNIPKNLKWVRIGPEVEFIEEAVFSYHIIEKLDFSEANSLRVICRGAFEGCTLPPTLRFPPQLQEIRERAFASCQNINHVDLSDARGLRRIGSRAFYDCSDLETAVLPASITEFADDAFKDCSNALKLVMNGKGLRHMNLVRNGKRLRHMPKELKRDKWVVLPEVANDGLALQYAEREFRGDLDIVEAAVKNDGNALQFASNEVKDDKDVVLAALNTSGASIQYASERLQHDKDVVLAALRQDGNLLKSVSECFRLDKECVLAAISSQPGALRFALGGLKGFNQDPDCLIAAGLWDDEHGRDRQKRRIILSTRFSLGAGSTPTATEFTILFKKHPYFRDALQAFQVYSPNAFIKQTCDPNWTDIDWPCRGTKETCQMKDRSLCEGPPRDECCWRYSYRWHLADARDSGGFMIQVVEWDQDGICYAAGKGQAIESVMAEQVGTKVFVVHEPCYMDDDGANLPSRFRDEDIDQLANHVEEWYVNGCEDMGTRPIVPQARSVILQQDKDAVMAALRQDGNLLGSLPECFRGDKECVLAAVSSQPGALRFALLGLNQDKKCLIAAGLWDDEDELDQPNRKIVLSTRFSLGAGSTPTATEFTNLLKKHPYFRNAYRVYFPSAFNRNTCDPNWTDMSWPCRGTKETCQKLDRSLCDGPPRTECCWRYSSRCHLAEAKASRGFMIQIIELDRIAALGTNGRRHVIGKEQLIEKVMAEQVGTKWFLVYEPGCRKKGAFGTLYDSPSPFQNEDIDRLARYVEEWYSSGCKDMSPCRIHFPRNIDSSCAEGSPEPLWAGTFPNNNY